MIKLSLKISICTTFIAHSVIGMENPGGELLNILETAMRTSPLAAKALNEEKAFREKTIRQIDDLRDDLQRIKEDRDPEEWQKRILTQIQKDEETSKALDEALKSFQQGVSVRYSVKTHKTLPILEGVKTLLKESFFDLIDGKIPASYEYNQQTVTILGGENTTSIWGNSRGTYLKTALLYMLANQEESSKSFGNMGLPWFDDSALAHVVPLPDEIALDLSSYSFACSYEHQVKRGLVLPHSGYAFGGHRSEERYAQGKKFGPQDCSSWLGSFMESAIYTTADQLCAYRKLVGIPGLVPTGWENGPDARYLLENMEVAVVKDPSIDIKAGQIYWVRRFAPIDPDMTQTVGTSGHTALALGYLRDGNIVTIGYSRDMPSLEGFGIQNFSWAPEPLQIKGLFNVKGF